MRKLLANRTQYFVIPLLALPRSAKRLLALAVDVSFIVSTVWLAFYLRLDEWARVTGDSHWQPLWAVAASVMIALPLFVVHGFYRMIFRYAGMAAVSMVTRAFVIYGLMYAALVTAIGLPGVPRSVGIIQPLLLFLAVAGSRAAVRYWLGGLYQQQLRRINLPKVLIYGAGNAGRQLATALVHSHEMCVVGYLDDDDRLHGHVLNGLPIYNTADLPALVESLQVSSVLLAIPSLTRRRRNEILERIRTTHVAVRSLPTVSELVQGKVSVSDLREPDIDDLLGREPVQPNHILLAKNIVGKVVLVTGAGGSIGSELCRQILNVGPAKLLLVDQSEFALYAIHQELEGKRPGDEVPLVPLLASAQDAARMNEIMAAWHPNTVYHAAAYKHVPLVEHNPAEGIKNNVWGTLRTAQAAMRHGVTDFVLISTDKAVRPTNIMGTSKRLAELSLQALAASRPETKFSMVRFGNVLNSSGSVVPRFRDQIKNGGPITLTHPEITRYFMTIPEAAQLVIQAGAMAKGGEVFVLDMGEPVKIIDLARRMIELSGLTVKDDVSPDGDIEIEISGLRPGEKLYEELLIGNDPQPTQHPRILTARESYLQWGELERRLAALAVALDTNDVESIRCMIQELVADYSPSDEIVDWVYLAQEGKRRIEAC